MEEKTIEQLKAEIEVAQNKLANCKSLQTQSLEGVKQIDNDINDFYKANAKILYKTTAS